MSSYREAMAKRHAERRKVQTSAYKMNADLLQQVPAFMLTHKFQKDSALDRQRCYVAGPVTGVEAQAALHFAAVKKQLEDGDLALEVISPMADLGLAPTDEWEHCMAVCFYALMKCQRIHMLQGWERSRGASLELALAAQMGLQITFEEETKTPLTHSTL
jgi:hypothetical protein